MQEVGLASWYGPGFAGRNTANGEIFDPAQFTAAHKTLPFNTMVKVTRLDTGASVVVRINDRGPFKPGRIIDLSQAAAEAIDLIETGVARVELGLPSTRGGQGAVQEVGLASWYGPGFAGRNTANGEIFDPAQFTAAHKTLPFNTMVKVTRLDTGASVVVRINDRGPFKPGRIIDLSQAAAEAIDLIETGVARVELELLSTNGGRVPLVLDPSLSGFQVRSWTHAPGSLFVLASKRHREPLVVRAVGPEPVGTGAGLLVSLELFELLGSDAYLLSE
ncbi:MAG: septal ring lytic transglycosylase RlpA family protein [Truepera sp.]|nr:septal ring lytic transglycosylase RlpA family protein [Truepera sp.]